MLISTKSFGLLAFNTESNRFFKTPWLLKIFTALLFFILLEKISYSQYSIVPNIRTQTGNYSESSSYFLCPAGTVMTGRYHSGDENGTTRYEYATLKAINSLGQAVSGTITVEDVRWETSFKESSGSGFSAASNRVIVGRQHYGDENGQTVYATALVKFNAQATQTPNYVNSSSIRESSWNWYITPTNNVVVGRYHSGDENGYTYYRSATITTFTPTPAPAGSIIIPNIRTSTASYTESSSSFLCPPNTVMTGRSHTGDENGSTYYEYATLKAIDAQGLPVTGSITVEDVRWEYCFNESVPSPSPLTRSGFDAPVNRVIVGRQHSGDENGITCYATGVVKFNGFPTKVINYNTTTTKKESGGWNWFRTVYNQVVTGRHHMGDENGNTYYAMGTISCDVTSAPVNRFRVVVSLHPDENYYPMNPLDFMRLSRFRMHHGGETDDGFNKNVNNFLNNNDHSLEYYDIPVFTINSHYIPNYTKNYRPHDDNSVGFEEVFLEPDDNLRGDFNPNGRVPVFEYTSPSAPLDKEYWLFYGYDYAAWVISFSHQGDWEHVRLHILNNSIAGAWLGQHNKPEVYYTASQLNITEQNGVQTLNVYSAIGSHALYAQPGDYPTFWPNFDHAAGGGYQWVITDNSQSLATQPWRDYAGAWGEVGESTNTTGPLGPWYKRTGFVQSSASDYRVPLYYYYNASTNTNYYDRAFYPNGPSAGFVYKGILCFVYPTPQTTPATVPVYRYYNPGMWDNFYYPTNSPSMGNGGWPNAGLSFHAMSSATADNNLIPIYSYWNMSRHLLSPDKGLTAVFNGATYNRESVIFYAYPGTYSTSLRPANITSIQSSSPINNTDSIVSNKIYPNPTKGVFYLEFATALKKQKIKVLDANGRLVKVLEGSGNRISIDISDKAAGIYFVQVQEKNGTISKHRLVKL